MLFNFIANEDAYDRLIRENATEQLTDKQFIEREIRRFKISIKRHEMYCGENYYKGKQDILRRKRTAAVRAVSLKVWIICLIIE